MPAFIGAALVTVGLTALGGFVVGVGWAALAPDVHIRMGTNGLLSPSELEIGRIFAREGVFALVTGAAGVLAALAGRSWVLRSGPLAVVVLVLAGLAGSVVAWRVGVWAGPGPRLSTAGLEVGDTIGLPLTLRSKGLLLMWPICTTLVTMWVAVLSVATQHDDSSDAPSDGGSAPDSRPAPDRGSAPDSAVSSTSAGGAQPLRSPGL